MNLTGQYTRQDRGGGFPWGVKNVEKIPFLAGRQLYFLYWQALFAGNDDPKENF
jgi:hypothetical protein